MKIKMLFFAIAICLVFSACDNKADVSDIADGDLGSEINLVTETLTPLSTPIPNETKPTSEPALSGTEKPTLDNEVSSQTEAMAWVDGDDINFRESPSLDAKVISRLQNAQSITSISISGDWVFVQVDNVKGYVHKDFVSAIEPAIDNTTPSPEPTDDEIGVAENETSTKDIHSTVVFDRSSLTVAIDAGHQAKGNNEQEPIGPGSNTSKAKVSSGTVGVSTRIPEYKLTLAVSLKLRDELVARGYNVFMIRETHDVNISNKERASMATDAGADVFIRIHADGSENSSANGILTLSPTEKNPFIPELYKSSYELSKSVLDAMVEETGAKNRGVSKVDNMSGINWATMPVTIVEMGLMTNPKEDELMQTEGYQMKLVDGIANGIDNFFSTSVY